MTERFRVTFWPGGAQPIPALNVPESVERDGGWLQLQTGWGADTIELPVEFYLRQCKDIDLDDLDAVTDLVRQYGSPVPRDGGSGDLPGGRRGMYQRTIAEQAAKAGRSQLLVPEPSEPSNHSVHVEDVIYRLRVIRQLSAHAVAFRRGDYVAKAWLESEQERFAGTISILWRAVPDAPAEDSPAFRDAVDVQAWEAFTSFTDLALRPFHVRVWVDLGHQAYDIGVPRPTLYESAVLQIVNDMAEYVDYRVCPHCHRVFGHQVGRAEQGQNRRTGVTYCSPSCGSAARVKVFRARKRAEREKSDG